MTASGLPVGVMLSFLRTCVSDAGRDRGRAREGRGSPGLERMFRAGVVVGAGELVRAAGCPAVAAHACGDGGGAGDEPSASAAPVRASAVPRGSRARSGPAARRRRCRQCCGFVRDHFRGAGRKRWTDEAGLRSRQGWSRYPHAPPRPPPAGVAAAVRHRRLRRGPARGRPLPDRIADAPVAGRSGACTDVVGSAWPRTPADDVSAEAVGRRVRLLSGGPGRPSRILLECLDGVRRRE